MKLLAYLMTIVIFQSCILKGSIDISLIKKTTTLNPVNKVKNINNIFVGSRSCILHDQGLDCWGSNSNGSLGISALTSYLLAPSKLSNNVNISSVAIGKDHTCIAIDEGINCAGLGTSGELGNGGLTSSELFLQTLPSNSKVTDLDSGAGTTCAIIDGGLSCWGMGTDFQIGDGASINRNTPIEIFPPNSGVSKVSVGDRHSCAIVSSEVWCWGRNNNGQVGDSTLIDRSTPVKLVSLGSGVEDLSLGANHSCAIKNSGVYCWGINTNGQLGDNSQITRNTPTLVVPEGSSAQKISLGNDHSCALISDELFCWGSNQYGQMNNLVSLNPYLVPTLIFGASLNLTNMAAGDNQVCMVKQSQKVDCWGSGPMWGGSAYLGNGNDGNSLHWPSPTQVSGLSSNVTKIAKIQTLNDDGNYQNCSIHNGGVKCWGQDLSGALGDGAPSAESLIPVVTIPELSGVTDLSIYSGTLSAAGCAVVNGGVQCWGSGYGLSPVQIIASGSSVTEIKTVQVDSFSDRWSCAIASGGLKCWGTNEAGQVGDGTSTPRATPFDTIPTSSGVTAFDIGGSMSCAVISGGLKCWGYNPHGNIGNGNTTTQLSPVEVIASGSGVTSVSIVGYWQRFSGFGTTVCAVVNTGLKCWGHNANGTVGDGTLTNQLSPVDIFPAGSGVTKVGGRYPSLCAIKNSGLYCWGGNSGGLGLGDKIQRNTPTQVFPEGSGVTQFDLNGYVGCAIINGGLKCWGDNTHGSVGVGKVLNDYLTPVEVYPPGSNVQQIEIVHENYEANALCARVNDSLKCWGSNYNKSLGHGKASRGHFPVQGF